MLLPCREIGEEEISGLKDKVLAEVGKWLQRFDCIVIGPGLGRDPILLVHSMGNSQCIEILCGLHVWKEIHYYSCSNEDD